MTDGTASGRRVLAFPFHDWRKAEREGFRTRDAHLLEAFARRPDVSRILVVDRPSSLAERSLLRTASRAEGQVTSTWNAAPGTATITEVATAVDVLDLALPDFVAPVIRRRGWWFDVFARPSTQAAVDRAIGERLGEATDVVAWVPTVAPVLFRPGRRVVFDSLDNWLLHPTLRHWAHEAEAAYGAILPRADRVVTSGPASASSLARWRADIAVVPNGVDPAAFQSERRRPADLPSPPVVGYAGKLARRIDAELVAAVADSLPGVSFVFLGQVLDRRAIRAMQGHSNVLVLGDRPYETLPGYLHAFDVAWIPHRVGEGETGGDPIKLYEYWAAGRQVVSTRIDGSSAWEAQARLVTGVDETVAVITGILDYSLPPLPTTIPPGRTWDEIAAAVLDGPS